jgi:uncharacterized coiled-coil DUF342 family protein
VTVPNSTNSQKIDELRVLATRLDERIENMRQADGRRDTGLEAVQESLAEVRESLAGLKQQTGELGRRVDRWSARGRSFISLLVGALLSLASGLIVTLARK